jgi:hypothetical protein
MTGRNFFARAQTAPCFRAGWRIRNPLGSAAETAATTVQATSTAIVDPSEADAMM